MTDMKRITVSFSEDIESAIAELRQSHEFEGWSFSAIVRYLTALGLESQMDGTDNTDKGV